MDVGRARETGGTGLGLAIVKHLLGRYGSRLEVSSEVGVGSVFSCQFPSSVIKMSHKCNKQVTPERQTQQWQNVKE